MKKVRFLSGARADFLEATEHFAGISRSLASDFVDEVVRNLDLVVEFPEASPLVRGDIRKKVMRRFPYRLLYFVNDGTPVLAAVMQHRRRPDYWHRRVETDRKETS